MDRNLEKNCISALKSFVDILRDQAAVFTGYISELNSIVGRMENLSPKLTVLENREFVFHVFELIYIYLTANIN